MIKTIIVNISRILLSLTFIFSGFVKAVDPMGTHYKLQDYLSAMGLEGLFPTFATVGAAVILSTFEFSLGIFLLFAMMRKIVSRLSLTFMVIMTIITLWIWIFNPVSDCGCFGDALRLTNGETLLKNIILLIMAATVTRYPMAMPRFVTLNNQWIVFHYSILFSLAVSAWSLYNLPVFDFRPYHIGASIPEGMKIPPGEKGPEFETTFIMEKGGERKEFSLDDYPDSTWTFIDSKTTMVSEGYEPPIHDFSIIDPESGDDLTEDILSDKGYTLLLISPHLENADDSNFGDIDIIFEYAKNHEIPFYCLTASGEKAISQWSDITGAEYKFCQSDETTLKTIIRSNPGLLLIKNGTILGKWSHNMLPATEAQEDTLTQNAEATDYDVVTLNTIIFLLLWYILPLTVLVLADRLWLWSRWLKEREKQITRNIGINPVPGLNDGDVNKNSKNNEKENCSR